MSAGPRTVLASFERATAVQDDYGEEVETWTAQFEEWAAIFWGRGDERRQAAAEKGSQAATFQVLSNEQTRAVSIKDRITCEHGTFDIVGIAPDTPKRGTIELTATRAM